jgi:hypothetical protein
MMLEVLEALECAMIGPVGTLDGAARGVPVVLSSVGWHAILGFEHRHDGHPPQQVDQHALMGGG